MELDDIKTHTEEFLAAMGFDVSVAVDIEGGFFDIHITTNEADYLIGSGGRNLQDLHHVLKIFLSNRLQERVLFSLDVNGYMRRKEEYLRELARAMAERVRRSQEALTLKPMIPRERRIIHLELAAFPDIITESVGVDPERKLIVKPYP